MFNHEKEQIIVCSFLAIFLLAIICAYLCLHGSLCAASSCCSFMIPLTCAFTHFRSCFACFSPWHSPIGFFNAAQSAVGYISLNVCGKSHDF